MSDLHIVDKSLCSEPVARGELFSSLERLAIYIGSFGNVVFDVEIVASRKGARSIPLSASWKAIQPRGFTFSGLLENPRESLVSRWHHWYEENPVWQHLPYEGGLRVVSVDSRHSSNDTAAVWSLTWQNSYRFGEHVVITSPLFSMGHSDSKMAAQAWNVGANILGLRIQATPSDRGFSLETDDSNLQTIWPPQLPCVSDQLTMRIKPWLEKDEFYRRVWQLYRLGGKTKLMMAVGLHVFNEELAKAVAAFAEWRRPSEADLAVAWDCLQEWDECSGKYYSLKAVPENLGGYKQMCQLNRGKPIDDDLFRTGFGNEEIIGGVYLQRGKCGVYLAGPGRHRLDLKSLTSAMQLEFRERRLKWEH